MSRGIATSVVEIAALLSGELCMPAKITK